MSGTGYRSAIKAEGTPDPWVLISSGTLCVCGGGGLVVVLESTTGDTSSSLAGEGSCPQGRAKSVAS